jgi:hypothetical protein
MKDDEWVELERAKEQRVEPATIILCAVVAVIVISLVGGVAFVLNGIMGL